MLKYLFPPLWLLAVLAGHDVFADDLEVYPSHEFVPGEAWQEGGFQWPAFPSDKTLIEVPLQLPTFPYRLQLDTASLQVGDDYVTRYTAVITGAGGARNVLLDGIRCATSEYRSYAIGSGGEFMATRDDGWKPISDIGFGQYRAELVRYYLCSGDRRALGPRQILTRIQRHQDQEEHYY